MINLNGTSVTVNVAGIDTTGVVIGQDAETQHYVVRYQLDGGGTGTLTAPLDVVAPRIAAGPAMAATGATQILAHAPQPSPLRVWLQSAATFVRSNPIGAGIVAVALTGAIATAVLGADTPVPAATPVLNAPAPTPALVVAEKAYARTLTEQREAYAEPGGAFLGAVEAGRGYAPLAGNVPGYEYADVQGAGPVWLLVPTPAPAAPDALAVEVAPTAAPVVPQTIIEYVPVPVAPPAPAPAPVVADPTIKHAGPAKPEMAAERRQPDAALMERVRVGDPPAVNVIR